jgi:hypothetical protein
MNNTGGDRSSNLRDPSLVLYHCATLTLTNGSIIKIYIKIFGHFSEVRLIERKAKFFQFNVNLFLIKRDDFFRSNMNSFTSYTEHAGEE